MSNKNESRMYPRVSPDVHLNVMVKTIDKTNRKFFEGIIEDVSFGGMFIATDHPLSKGSMVVIEFKSDREENEQPVSAKGLVCWTRKWIRPLGMGIDFVEFKGLGNRLLEEWMQKHFKYE